MEDVLLGNFIEVAILVFSLFEYVTFYRGKESCNFIRYFTGNVAGQPNFDLYDLNIKTGPNFMFKL